MITRFLCIALFLSSNAFAALTGAALEDAIQRIISQRHPTDTRQTWLSLGPETPGMVQRMYARTDRPTEKTRLLQGLGWFSDPKSVDFLKEQATNSQYSMIRDSAIRSLGYSAGSAGTDFIAGFLTHPTDSTRVAAARSLQVVKSQNPGDPHVEGILKKFEAEEKVDWVRARAKGEALPETIRPMTPVARNIDAKKEDPAARMRAKWEGEWAGIFVMGGAKAPVSETVRFRFVEGRAEGWRGIGKDAKSVSGNLEVSADGTTAKLKIESWEGKASLNGGLRFEDEILKWDGPGSVGLLRKSAGR